jgi:Nucleoside-diphosphate-sugar epimerases
MDLVTGATGHIGNVLVRELRARGRQVRVLVLPGEDLTPLHGTTVQVMRGNVLDPRSLAAAFEGIETVYHLAGVISIMPGPQPQLQRVNVDGTKNVILAALHCHVRRLVYASSIHALKYAPAGQIVDENLPFDPKNSHGAYDRSKAEASLAVLDACRHRGLDAVLVCPTGVIGPYDFNGSEMGEVVYSASSVFPMSYIDGAYDFVDVRDVVDGMIAAAQLGRCGQTYILGGNRVTVRGLVQFARSAANRLPLPSIKVPLFLAKLGAQIMPTYYRWTGKRPALTPYALETLASNSTISHAKAEAELGFRSRLLSESIRDTLCWRKYGLVLPVSDPSARVVEHMKGHRRVRK